MHEIAIEPARTRCAICHTYAKTYDCEHTDYNPYCKECYMDLHYNLTEP